MVLGRGNIQGVKELTRKYQAGSIVTIILSIWLILLDLTTDLHIFVKDKIFESLDK